MQRHRSWSPPTARWSTDLARGRLVVGFPRRFREAIARADVVSFDVFDTLVVRSTWEPRHVFQHMERTLVDDHGPVFQAFARCRHASEVAEADSRWQTDRGREFTLEDVYARFGVEFPAMASMMSRRISSR